MKSQTESWLPSYVDVSRETLDRLHLLFEWHEKCKNYGSFARYNSEEEFWKRHIGNSLHLSPHLKHNDIILDIGSGGGFPGLVLAAMNFNVILSDVDQKKRFFLVEALRQMGLSCAVIGDSRLCKLDFTVTTARAVTNLNKLFTLVPNVSRETRGLFFKGKNFEQEITEAKKDIDFTHIVHKYDEGAVLEVTWKT